jgi:thiamine biosynthesis protein ThiS
VTLQLNGETREIEAATNVAELVDTLKLPAPAILVEHNGTALRPDEWRLRTLSENDRIELVRIVAGG